jgi:hypothetical protein
MRYAVPTARIVAAVLSSALLAACGGGGSAVRTLPAAPKDGSATIRLTIPAPATASATLRAPRYVSPSTKSLLIAVQYVNGQPTTFPSIALNVVVPSAQCPAPAQGGESEVCTYQVILPVGSVAMTITTYDQPLSGNTPSGNALSSVSVTQQLSGNGDPILLTLNGVPVSATLALSTSPVAVGTASNITVSATALDADGNLIVGPGNYTAPITVAVTDPSGRVTVSQGSIAAPGANATLAYNGASGLTKATVTGNATGVTVHSATLAFIPGLVRSDNLALLTVPVNYMTLSPDGSKLHIPYHDPTNGNAPALLVVDATARTIVAHPVLAGGTTATPFNVAYANGDAFVPYSDGSGTYGTAQVIIATSTLSGNSSSIYVPQYLVIPPSTDNGFALGTATTLSPAIVDYPGVTGAPFAEVYGLNCGQFNQCLAVSSDGALVYGIDAGTPQLLSMHVSDGTSGPTIGTAPLSGTALTFAGSTMYLAGTTSGGANMIDTLAYPSGSPASFVALPQAVSALAVSGDGATLFASQSSGPSPLELIDIASKTVVTFGPNIALGSFSGGFVSPVPIANVGASRRFLVIKEYQQPAGTLHTTLDEYQY